jgi:hypothetical protein
MPAGEGTVCAAGRFSRHAAGNHSKEMLARGFSVRATDGSLEMATIALQRLNHPLEAMLFHELDARAAYDGVWASACLLHVSRAEARGAVPCERQGRPWRWPRQPRPLIAHVNALKHERARMRAVQ